jgi:asparagine synthase (glutamine-hydrolysing)
VAPFGGCGIAGILRFAGCGASAAAPSLAPMVAALAHRGPDGDGLWRHGPVELGHRRLSIQDPTDRGRQPMTRDHLTITFNGEIYNFAELRRTLEGEGFHFDTGTDTEVLLRAFQRWDEDCLGRLNGMFAFALWDDRRQALFLARDRLGKKPLYFHRGAGAFVFASEVKALLRSGVVPGRPCWEAVGHQLLVRSFFEHDLGRTLVEGVEALPSAHLLWVHPDGRSHRRSYWQLPPERRAAAPEAVLAGELRELLHDSVRLRLVSDVPVAAFLSGGIDSSLLNALACRQAAGPLQSFTLRYLDEAAAATEAADDDLAHALLVADALGGRLRHQVVDVRPAALDLALLDEITDLATLADDERHPSLLASYRAIQERGLKVVLNGHGADETQGGYLQSNPFVAAALRPGPPVDVRDAICPRLSLVAPEALHPDLLALRPAVFQAVADRYQDFAGEPLRQGHSFLVWTQLQRVLRFEDFLSMRCGVECRLPFLDHRVVEWAFSIPFGAHVDPATGGGKALLRRAAAELLPRAVVERPKRQFPKPPDDALERAYRALYERHRPEIIGAEINRRVFRPRRLQEAAPPLAEIALAVLLWRWEAKVEAACACGQPVAA